MIRDLAGSNADQAITFFYDTSSQIVARTNSNDAYAPIAHGSSFRRILERRAYP